MMLKDSSEDTSHPKVPKAVTGFVVGGFLGSMVPLVGTLVGAGVGAVLGACLSLKEDKPKRAWDCFFDQIVNSQMRFCFYSS